MAESGHYRGGAFVALQGRQAAGAVGSRAGKVGGPVPKGHKRDKAEWLKPGLVGRVKTLTAKRNFAMKLLDFWEVRSSPIVQFRTDGRQTLPTAAIPEHRTACLVGRGRYASTS